MKNKNKIYKNNDFTRFMRYVKPYYKYIAIAAAGGVVKFVMPLLVPQVFRYIIDNILLNTTASPDQKIREITIYVLCLAGGFIFFFAPWTYVRHYYAGKAGHKSVFF